MHDALHGQSFPLVRLGRELGTAVQAVGVEVMALRATLILLILYGATSSAAAVVIRMTAGLMLLCEPLLRNSWLWALLASAVAASNAMQWQLIDNHKYLITYWIVACIVATHGTRRDYLAQTARRLTALVFLAATFWKLLAAQYLDGTFLYVTALNDSRLLRVAAIVAGVPLADLQATAAAVNAAGQSALEGVQIPLLESAVLWRVAIAMSWATVVGEGLVGVVHLVRSDRLYSLRHLLLIGFILLTYLLLPVTPFAFVLGIMGLAQCQPDDKRMKMIYVLVLGFVQLTIFPWQSFLPRT
jgi:hypothetical protein